MDRAGLSPQRGLHSLSILPLLQYRAVGGKENGAGLEGTEGAGRERPSEV